MVSLQGQKRETTYKCESAENIGAKQKESLHFSKNIMLIWNQSAQY